MNEQAVAPVRDVIPGTRRYTQHTIHELAATIRERDQVTYAHCRRVAIYVNRLARSLGLGRQAARDLALAGLVHDLGKTWMHNNVLNKESALSLDERQEMERHPAIAARILQAYGVPDHIIEIVLHHHERYDGLGYPDHLKGDEIPYGARLLSVADVFDALTSARPYKGAMSVTTACERIASGKGTHFDPRVADAFLALVAASPNFLLPADVEPAAEPHVMWARHDVLDS